jgi:hypothetical protein
MKKVIKIGNRANFKGRRFINDTAKNRRIAGITQLGTYTYISGRDWQ